MRFRFRLIDIQIEWGEKADDYVEKSAAIGFSYESPAQDEYEDEDPHIVGFKRGER